MPSTFTTNKSIEKPASGSFNNAWAAPVNADWDDIDTAFGGSTIIPVTGVVAGTYGLTLAQYKPPNIIFSGTLTANLTYVLPSGVGGIWTIFNNTSGAFTITFGISGGGSLAVQQSQRSLVVSDGSVMQLADTAAASQAQTNAQNFATSADATVLSTAETFASNAANTAQSNAQAFAANASNLSSGTVANARLPNIGNMPGVTIQADPGGTPSGSPGQMFMYY